MEEIYNVNKKINSILRYPEKLRCDLRLHMLIGVVLVAILTIFTVNVFVIAPILVTASWGIEIFQKITKSGTYDNYDALAVVAGGLIVYLSHML